jgi:threonyl-tRNA synthetase
MSITITLPDGSKKEAEKGITPGEIAKGIGAGLYKSALAASVNGSDVDLDYPIQSDSDLSILTFSSGNGKDIFWHSSAHIIAQAVKRLFPSAQLTIGPVVKSGPGFFYYDIDYEKNFTDEDLRKIEMEANKIIKENLPIKRKEMSKKDAVDLFKKLGENYKIEMINELDEPAVTVYSQGEFDDMCRGPHVPSTKKIEAFKLTTIAGAYWRGDPSNKMLQRIYGISFPSKKELKKHLQLLEEAKKRDHRKLGAQLDLFSFHPEGPGFPFWHRKGTIIFNLLQEFIREKLTRLNYHEIRSPLVLNEGLWKQSGHWDNFQENMYFTQIDKQSFAIKPMNCPGHNLIYKNQKRSYRELPLKFAEFGVCHRYEAHGALHGLFRVRSFTMDDAHIYADPEFLQNEIQELIKLTIEIYHTFGFKKIDVYVATRPEENYLGTEEIWEKSTRALFKSCDAAGLEYKIKEGEGAFYGPKIEFNIKDCLDRNWQCGTIQVDFSMPERFDLKFTGSDGNDHQPVMIHRAILGSMERFIGILIEHYNGKFPLWLSPVQVILLPINDAQNEYVKEIKKKFSTAGIRTEVDLRSEKIGYKIRWAIAGKINYMAVIGESEIEKKEVNVRRHGEQKSTSYKIDDFISFITDEISSRRIDN